MNRNLLLLVISQVFAFTAANVTVFLSGIIGSKLTSVKSLSTLPPSIYVIGILCTEATLKTKVYNKYFDDNFELICPDKTIQKNSVNKSIKLVKMGKVKEAEKALRPAVNHLIKQKCEKIILGCTELPIALFAYKSFKKAKESKLFIDPNLLLAEVCMKKYKK